MAGGLMDGVDNGLPDRPYFIDVFIEIENPSKRLLRRCDIVALRAEDHDRRANIAQVDRHSVRGLNLCRCQLIPDKQLIDDELNLFGVQADMAAPPALEFQIARSLSVDFRVKIVRL